MNPKGWLLLVVTVSAPQLACAVPYAEETKLASGSPPVHFPPGFRGDADAAWHLQHIFGDSGRIKFRGYFKRDLGGKTFYKMTHKVPHGHAMERAIKKEFGDYSKYKMPRKRDEDWMPKTSRSVFKKQWSSAKAVAPRVRLAQSAEGMRAKSELEGQQVVSDHTKFVPTVHGREEVETRELANGEVVKRLRKDRRMLTSASLRAKTSKLKLAARRKSKQARQIRELQETVEALTSQLTTVKHKVTSALKPKKQRATMLGDGSIEQETKHKPTKHTPQHNTKPAPTKALSKWLSKHTVRSSEAALSGDYATESQLMEEKYGQPPHVDAPLKKVVNAHWPKSLPSADSLYLH